MMIEVVRDFNLLAFEVGREAHAPGIDNIGEIKIAGRNLVQHRGKQKEVIAIDERYLDILVAGESIVEMHRGMQTREAAAQNQNPRLLAGAHKSVFSSLSS